MNKFYVILLALVISTVDSIGFKVAAEESLFSDSISTMSETEFRSHMRNLVSKGNKYYDRSYRRGIINAADAISFAIYERSFNHMICEEDSLEFTADCYKLYADWYYENGNYDSNNFDSAETYFKQAIGIYESNSFLRGLRTGLPMLHREMAQLKYRTGDYEQALSYTQLALDAFVSDYENGEFEQGDEDYNVMLELRSQLAMCEARTGNIEKALSDIDELLKEYPSQSEKYYEMLRKKGKILMISGSKNCNEKALEYYKKFFAWQKKSSMSFLGEMTAEEREDYWMRIRPFVADCYQTEDADPAFLYDVTLFAKGLLLQINRLSGEGKTSDNALKSLQYTWRNIQFRLSKDACAVEFVQYEKLGKKKMAALILKPSGKPKWVAMLTPGDFLTYESGVWKNEDRIYDTEGKKKNALYNDSILKYEIWNEQLRKAIKPAKKLYFAPDGYLHQIAAEYMLPSDMAAVKMFRLTSTRRLMENPHVRTDSALIVGGPNYNTTSIQTDFGNDADAYYNMQNIRVRFSELPGALKESILIAQSRDCISDTLLLTGKASELTFRKLCSLYPILSISTHGYFMSSEVPQGTDIKPCLTDESLSECIVALAGANTSIQDYDFNSDLYDGIVSARELSQCDMSNVDLAVISACQTGLGYVTADGVYGIQRGLKNAGVGCMLVSLWNVSDNATAILMTNFHKNLSSGMTVRDAFDAARESLCNVSSDASKSFDATRLVQTVSPAETYSEPQYRNAFILIDALE